MNFKKIQYLKKNKLFIKDGFNYILPQSIKLYKNSNSYLMKCIIFGMMFKPKLIYKNNGLDILISYPFKKGKREDYEEIINNLKKIVGHYNEMYFEYKFDLRECLKNISKFYIFFKKLKNIPELSFKEKLIITSLSIMIKKIKCQIEKINFKEKILITFCDAHFEENILTQLLKRNKIKTITLQHGQYRYYDSFIKNENVEAYKNFISDFIFVWGETTKIELLKSGIDKNKILKVGALKNFQKIKNKNRINENIFCLVLDGETYRESNLKMIEISNGIASAMKKKYYIRFHPMNNKKYYEKKILKDNYIKEVSFELNPEFYIMHMTSVMLETLCASKPFFIYNDEFQVDIFKIKELLFSNLDEFLKKYKRKNKINYRVLYKEYNYEDDYIKLKSNYILNLKEILKRKGENN